MQRTDEEEEQAQEYKQQVDDRALEVFLVEEEGAAEEGYYYAASADHGDYGDHGGALGQGDEFRVYIIDWLMPDLNGIETVRRIRKVIGSFNPGDWLILQNEINGLPLIVDLASARGMKIVLNPSPYDGNLKEVDFGKLDWLLVNEIEAEQLTGQKDPVAAWNILHEKYPRLSLLITLGSRGSIAWQVDHGTVESARAGAVSVKAVDTTAAGDTYTGFFVTALTEGKPLKSCMDLAARAAAIAVTRPGAADSIPLKEELV